MLFQFKDLTPHILTTQANVVALAQQLNELGGTESEREDRATRMARIKGKVLNAEMTPFRWCVGRIPSEGIARRVNGQHSSQVFLSLTPEEWGKVVFPVVVEWEEYICENRQGLAYLFEQFDPNWSSRNKEDLIGAHLGTYDELQQGIDRYVANKATQGLAWYREKVQSMKHAAERQFGLIHENHDVHEFLRWCGSFLTKAKTPEMMDRPVMAVMYHTTVQSNDDSREFWKRVAMGKAHHDADTLEYKLAEFYDLVRTCKLATDWPANIRRTLKANRQSISDKDVFSTGLRGFAAYRKGTKVTDIYTPAKDRSPAQLVADLYPLATTP